MRKYYLILASCFIYALPNMSMHALTRNFYACLSAQAQKNICERGSQELKKRAFVEISGTEVPCQRKTLVLLSLLKKAKAHPDCPVIQKQLGLFNIIQAQVHENHISEKTLKANWYDFTGEQISLRNAKKILKELTACANHEVRILWDDLKQHPDQSDADICFDYLEREKIPVLLAGYLGSPTLENVIGHRFQYVYQGNYNPRYERHRFEPNIIDREPHGVAPKAGENYAVFHCGMPNFLYNQLKSKNYTYNNFFTKLNLDNLDLKKAMQFGLEEMRRSDKLLQEPGLASGEFRYPFSMYHFSCSPCWPGGGQKSFLGRNLNYHVGLDIKSDLYREIYSDTNYSPLEIYPVYPNIFLGPFAEIPGYEFKIVKKGYILKLRLVFSHKTLFAKPHEIMREERYNYHDKNYTQWSWDENLTGFFINIREGAINSAQVSEKDISKFYELITRAIKTHLEINFCYKTRWLLDQAQINLESFTTGILKPDNAHKFYTNGKNIRNLKK